MQRNTLKFQCGVLWRGQTSLKECGFVVNVVTLCLQVWFSVCAEGSLQGALSLWLVENSTREEESRMLWGFENSSGAKGWSRLAIPVHGVSDR